MKVLISGSSGVGKSTTIAALADLGFTAVDSDDVPGLARLESTKTGEPTEWPTGFIDWSEYSWNWQESVLLDVLNTNDTIFIGAINSNQDKYYHLFDALIVLTLTPEEHLHRMQTRPHRGGNDDPINIEARLKKYPKMLQSFIDAGFTPVDANGTPESTAKAVLQVVGLAPPKDKEQ